MSTNKGKLNRKDTICSFKSLEKPDFILIFNQSRFLYHKRNLKQIQLFKDILRQNRYHSAFLINQDIDEKIFSSVIRCFYGHQYKFERNWEVFEIMKVLQYLRQYDMIQELIKDIEEFFQQYDFFVIYTIAFRFKVKSLQKKCIRQIIKYKFQQLNFNKLDLIKCQKDVFLDIIKTHESLVNDKKIKGQGRQNIRKLVNQVCNINDFEIKSSEYINLSEQQQKNGDKENQALKKLGKNMKKGSLQISYMKKMSDQKQNKFKSKQLNFMFKDHFRIRKQPSRNIKTFSRPLQVERRN